MTALELLEAMDQINDDIILDAISAGSDKKNKKTGLIKPFRTIVLIAAIVATLSCTVIAAERLISTPEKAWEMMQEEFTEMINMGILSEEVTLSERPYSIVESSEELLDKYWFERFLHHRYSIISKNEKYTVYSEIDTADGMIYKFTIESHETEEEITELNEENTGTNGLNYDNYPEIFISDMTIDQFCMLLAEYWGYSGYTLTGTKDDFYGYDTEVQPGDALLIELYEEPYITIYFNGDQNGTPMYVQFLQFPGYLAFSVGTRHFIG